MKTSLHGIVVFQWGRATREKFSLGTRLGFNKISERYDKEQSVKDLVSEDKSFLDSEGQTQYQ